MEGKETVGVWLVGARGTISSAVICGLELLKRGAIAKTGLFTETLVGVSHNFVEYSEIVVGGCDLIESDTRSGVRSLVQQNILPWQHAELLSTIEWKADDNIVTLDKRCFSNGSFNKTLQHTISLIRGHIAHFKATYRLDRVIVVDCSSTSPVFTFTEIAAGLSTWSQLDDYFSNSFDDVSHSLLYAASAFNEGCAYINFTPNVASEIPALKELAVIKGIPHAGKDGKTGETLVKSVLAPLFLHRNLEVMSWQGYNMLGNADGKSLSDPRAKESKISSKSQSLTSILPHDDKLHANVSIDYVPSLGDWKVAWDFVHFKGFFDTAMSMDFTWRGCDTALAAPLVIDLVRLVDLDWRKGKDGVLKHLAAFFKSPTDFSCHDFHQQMQYLHNYLRSY